MAEAAYNLVIVRGAKNDLGNFEKQAYKNESQAFSLEKLFPLPRYLENDIYSGNNSSDEAEAFRHIIYGGRWAAFGILIRKTDTFLEYYLSTKYYKANLDYLALKFKELKFTQVFIETFEDCRFGFIEYKNGLPVYDSDPFFHEFQPKNLFQINWEINSRIHTYPYIAELYNKIKYYKKNNTEEFKKTGTSSFKMDTLFFSIIDKTEYLKKNENFYDSLFELEMDLEKRELFYARYMVSYNFKTNSIDDLKNFVQSNFLSPEIKARYIERLNGIQPVNDLWADVKWNHEDWDWWDSLDKTWQDELITNLLRSPAYAGKRISNKKIAGQISKANSVSNDIIAKIATLEELDLSTRVLYDLTPLLYMKNIRDFQLQRVDYTHPYPGYFIEMYPKQLRSKVKSLDIHNMPLPFADLSELEEFVNLEHLCIQDCRVGSLTGIEKLTKLKTLNADQGNSYNDLNPLRGLNLKNLNMQFKGLNDISPLMDVPSIEVLDLWHTYLNDLTPLLYLPNLKRVTLPDEHIIEELIIDRQMNTVTVCTEYNEDVLNVFVGSLEAYLKSKYITLPDGRIVIEVLPDEDSINEAETMGENYEKNDEEFDYEGLPF
jgi:hypothetical protein